VRKITEDEIRHYQKHGVVYLPDLLDAGWLKDMEAAFAEEMFADPAGLNHLDLGFEGSFGSLLGPDVQLAAVSSFREAGLRAGPA
jgi:hypothetical protein